MSVIFIIGVYKSEEEGIKASEDFTIRLIKEKTKGIRDYRAKLKGRASIDVQ